MCSKAARNPASDTAPAHRAHRAKFETPRGLATAAASYTTAAVAPIAVCYDPLQRLFGRLASFELFHLASMAAYSHDGRRLAMSERVVVDGVDSIDVQGVKVMAADGSQGQRIFCEPRTAAMSPKWTPDDQSFVVGVGGGFQTRNTPARIVMMNADGSNVRTLTSAPGAGFPSLSPDGKRLVFRVWGTGAEERGLRVLALASGEITRLTGSEYDTFPGWSPAGDLIAFSSWT